jgi:hypothetical protein
MPARCRDESDGRAAHRVQRCASSTREQAAAAPRLVRCCGFRSAGLGWPPLQPYTHNDMWRREPSHTRSRTSGTCAITQNIKLKCCTENQIPPSQPFFFSRSQQKSMEVHIQIRQRWPSDALFVTVTEFYRTTGRGGSGFMRALMRQQTPAVDELLFAVCTPGTLLSAQSGAHEPGAVLGHMSKKCRAIPRRH